MKLTSKKSWTDLHQDRYRWAEESFTAFLRKFDAERLIQTANNASKQVSVVLYGPAQVGKTSLILTLLGIRDDCFNELNTLLRGEEKLGNASTARTYRYRMAKDNFWYFSNRDHGRERLQDYEAKAFFAELREEVEQGMRNLESVDVFLPRRFFDPEVHNSTQLLIRDLPGTHAANANEQYYVNLLANRYLASADVVLLTGKADALTFLRPEELDNPLLNDWHWQRHRYKIVLTRAYSDATLKARIVQQNDDKATLQAFLLAQVNTLDLGLPDDMSELIYPVECGHTWLAITARDDEYARRCRKLRREVLQDLLTSLCQASNPLARLRTGYALPQIISQQMAAEQALFDVQVALLDKQITHLENNLEIYRQRTSSTAEKLAQLDASLREVERAREDALSQSFSLEVLDIGYVFTPSLDMFKSKIDAYRNGFKKLWDDLLDTWELPLERVPETTNLDKVLNRLNGYWFDRYFLDKTREEDRQEIEAAQRKDVNCLTALFYQRIKFKLDADILAIKQAVTKGERTARRLTHVHSLLVNKLARTAARRAHIATAFTASVAVNTQRHQESKNFLNVILSAKNDRASEIERHVRNPAISRSERLGWLLMFKALTNDFDYVKSLRTESSHLE